MQKLRFYQQQVYDLAAQEIQEATKRGQTASTVAQLATGSGKAQPVENPIITDTGCKKIGEMKIGDVVFTPDGTPSSVLGVYPQGMQDTYKVSFDDGTSTLCSLEHLWEVQTRFGKYRGRAPKVKTTEALLSDLKTKDGHNKWFIPVTKPVQFSHKDLPIPPYLLGALLGGGGIKYDLLFSNTDKEILDKMNELLAEYDCRLKFLQGCDYRVSSGYKHSLLMKKLKELDLFGKGSYDKFIPKKYLRGSKQQRLSLLRGLMDTDGAIHKSSSHCEFGTASIQLAKDFCELVRSLGGVPRIRKKHTKSSFGLFYRIGVSIPDNPFSLSRKASFWKKNVKQGRTKAIIRIEKDLPKECVCIKIADPRGLYLTNDFIATHNTVIFSQFPKLLPPGKRMLILAHRDDLLLQAKEKMQKWNPDISVGIEGGKYRAGEAQVVIGSVQTIGRKNQKRIKAFNPEDFYILVVDEAHHAVASQYQRVIEYFNKAHHFGFTATVTRHDGRGLIKIYNKLLYEYSLQKAIRDRWLCPIRAYRVKTKTDLDGVALKGNDFDLESLGEILNNDERNRIILEAWERNSPGKTLIFAANVEHSKSLADMFLNAGYKAAHIDGYMNLEDRRKIVKRYKDGDIQVLTNAAVTLEGFDAPQTQCVIMARRTKSTPLYQQMLGRLTRTWDGKKYPEVLPKDYPKPYGLLLDLVDNARTNSAVTVNDLFGLPQKIDPEDATSAPEVEGASWPGEDLLSFVLRAQEHMKREAMVLNLTQHVEIDQVVLDIFKTLPSMVSRDKDVQWYPDGDRGFYATVIKDGQTGLVGLKENLLGQWELFWNNKSAKHNGPWDNLREALRQTKKILRKQFKDSRNIWAKYPITQGWGCKPASEKQKELLLRAKKACRIPMSILVDNLTRGEAAHLITMLRYNTERKDPDDV